MRILGINSVFHESSAALIEGGRVVAAAEEERFTRTKHAKPARVDNPHELPEFSIRFCLEHAGIRADDLGAVAYSFDPDLRRRNFELDPLSSPGNWGDAEGERAFLSHLAKVPQVIEKSLGRTLRDELAFIPHHISHAASSFFTSGFKESAILIVDGIGEACCTMLARGDSTGITPLASYAFPHSIGFLWEKISQYLGFSEYDACKTMGLAAYGDATVLAEAFRSILQISETDYSIDGTTARFRRHDFSRIEQLLGPKREPNDPILPHHRNAAAALQASTNNAVLTLARKLRELTGSRNCCFAGGVALNCVTNNLLKESGLFSEVYVPFAPHDAGTAIGAALQLHREQGGIIPHSADGNPYLGPEFDEASIVKALDNAQLSACRSSDPARDAAAMIAAGKVVAWFQGRMEFGPRALGNRSLLADPRSPLTRDMLNCKVKHREDFRPFAPSVLAEVAGEWFEIGNPSHSHDYMLYACRTKTNRRDKIPAVLHEDGSARLQLVHKSSNPSFYALISHFHTLTGVPMVLNTSFNDSEPIVCNPEQAVMTFRKTQIDVLFMGNHIVTRGDQEA